LAGKDVYGIRSQLDDKERVMPEALAELWRTKAVAPEALPRLLAQIQPTLRRTDMMPLLHMRAHRWLAGAFAGLGLALGIAAARAGAGGGGPTETRTSLAAWLARPAIENEYVITEGPVPIEGTVDVDFAPRVPAGVLAADSGGHYTAAWFRAGAGSRLMFAPRALAPALAGGHLALAGVTVQPEAIGFPAAALADLRARAPGLDAGLVTALYWTPTGSGAARSAGGAFLGVLATMSVAGAAIIYFMIALRQGRRRAQMAWLLARR
jgi:hypothetical protein